MQYHPPLKESNVIDGLGVGYLKLFRFWNVINDYRRTGKRNAYMNFHFISSFIICTPYIVLQLTCYFFIDVDIQKATIINLHCLPGIILWSRVILFWFRLESLCKLYDLVQKDFIYIPQNKMAKASIIYRKITRSANIMCIIAFIADFGSAVANIGIPGIPVDYIQYHKGSMFDVKTGRKKILSGWYPVPMGESPYYEMIFVYEMICILLGGTFQPTYASLFYQILVALHAQFVVLGHRASTIKISSKSNSDNNLVHSDSDSNSTIKKKTHEYRSSGMNEDLRRVIQDHQKLLSYAEELQNVYNPLVAMNLGPAILFLIVSLFQFLTGEIGDFIDGLKGLQFLAAQMVELFMFCYCSSSLQSASSDLQLAVYKSDWYKADSKYRKSAQILMIRAKKGVTLTALKMYPVNKETLVAIFQYVYSTCALMSRMLEK